MKKKKKKNYDVCEEVTRKNALIHIAHCSCLRSIRPFPVLVRTEVSFLTSFIILSLFIDFFFHALSWWLFLLLPPPRARAPMREKKNYACMGGGGACWSTLHETVLCFVFFFFV